MAVNSLISSINKLMNNDMRNMLLSFCMYVEDMVKTSAEDVISKISLHSMKIPPKGNLGEPEETPIHTVDRIATLGFRLTKLFFNTMLKRRFPAAGSSYGAHQRGMSSRFSWISLKILSEVLN